MSRKEELIYWQSLDSWKKKKSHMKVWLRLVYFSCVQTEEETVLRAAGSHPKGLSTVYLRRLLPPSTQQVHICLSGFDSPQGTSSMQPSWEVALTLVSWPGPAPLLQQPPCYVSLISLYAYFFWALEDGMSPYQDPPWVYRWPRTAVLITAWENWQGDTQASKSRSHTWLTVEVGWWDE